MIQSKLTYPFALLAGKSYDRTDYGKDDDEFSLRRLREEQRKAAEKDRLMTLQPVRPSEGFDESQVSADTTGLLGLFLNLLTTENYEKNRIHIFI